MTKWKKARGRTFDHLTYERVRDQRIAKEMARTLERETPITVTFGDQSMTFKNTKEFRAWKARISNER